MTNGLSDELVLHCLQTGEESAWIEFVRRFQPLIAGVVMRVGRRWGESSCEVLDDLVQETYLKLCADRESLLRNFQATHPDAVFGFVKVFTANLVHDHFKGVHSKKRGGGTRTEPADDNTPEAPNSASSDAKSIERAILLSQIDVCLLGAESGPNAKRDRNIFWLYYRVGLPASAIAALPTIGLTTKGVESTILRMTRAVRQRLSSTGDPPGTEDRPPKGIRPAESF
jgi:RNA polymerase sigma-70 factor, ECF subfamily